MLPPLGRSLVPFTRPCRGRVDVARGSTDRSLYATGLDGVFSDFTALNVRARADYLAGAKK